MCFGKRPAGEGGTEHLQGTLKLKNRKRLTGMKTMIGHTVYWEITKCIKASLAYCSKQETRTGKLWVHGIDVEEEAMWKNHMGGKVK